jgi:hypothetical protein
MTEALWEEYITAINRNKPSLPGWSVPAPQTTIQRAWSDLRRADSVIGNFMGALNRSPGRGSPPTRHSGIPAQILKALSIENEDDLALAQADYLAGQAAQSFLPIAGTMLNGLLMILRGSNQHLTRTLEMERFLIGTFGYTRALANYCIKTSETNSTSPRMPNDFNYHWERERDLLIHTSSQRDCYRNAGLRVMETINTLNREWPRDVDITRPQPAAACLILTYDMYRPSNPLPLGTDMFRRAFEDYLLQEILGYNMSQLRQRLNSLIDPE